MFLFKLKLDWVLCIVTDTERGFNRSNYYDNNQSLFYVLDFELEPTPLFLTLKF